ncbi:MAG: hypothetical protein CMN87_18130 [Stappia sp.]|uniref:YHS domain-containing (seleno)protein n=1 Tax=Stappia sp. TaxID=1870903 RepID=UPI000C47F424|nr:YHS domain-containing (seleno)protein [Stappia sp.]MAA97391.1 hypothetical protein [Stappia sp.]MBM21924.1 hypothetical protein [Stappia sp.]|tara:strand:- start:2498 stop:2998 length:501 start_codon:yes stop_codon:yes gene_type:complete
MKGLSRRTLLALACLGGLGGALVASGGVRAGWFGFGSNDTGPVFTGIVEGVAVGGYDPVAYFREGRPVKGDPSIAATWRGANWRFSSEENRAAFETEPEKYAPAYGGYCSWAVAQGKLAKGDPENWDIVEGRLYLNYNDKVQSDWRKDIPGFVAKANEEWPGLADR